MSGSALFFGGTSGLALPVPNKKAYPPAFANASRLEYYSHLFNSIEINSSFYKIPRGVTIAKWASVVPADFLFTFKLNREITHSKGFKYSSAVLADFMHAVSESGKHAGALLIQFPASIGAEHQDQLEELLVQIQQYAGSVSWDLAIEFRNRSWYRPETDQLLNRYNAVIVQHDMPASAPPAGLRAKHFTYLRFHGVEGDYRGSYPPELVNQYAGQIVDSIDQRRRVYAYFNNTIGDAVANLQSLMTAVSKMRDRSPISGSIQQKASSSRTRQ